jgi:hypothetical protein
MRRRFIGNDQTRASAMHAVEATGMQLPPPRVQHRGNLAGLSDQKSAFLQHNQGGYYNPNIQRARYSTDTIRSRIPNITSNTLSPSTAGRMLDNRMLTNNHKSLTRLLKLIK